MKSNDNINIIKSTYNPKNKTYTIKTYKKHENSAHKFINKSIDNRFNTTQPKTTWKNIYKIFLNKHLTQAFTDQHLFKELITPFTQANITPIEKHLEILAPPKEHISPYRPIYSILIGTTGEIESFLQNQNPPNSTTHLKNSKIKWRKI